MAKIFISVCLFLFLNGSASAQEAVEPGADEANDWFYYRSEYRDLLKKKKLSDKEFNDLKIKYTQESSELKKENDLLKARIQALESEINSTREAKLTSTREADKRFVELDSKLSSLEESRKQYEEKISELKKEKDELAKKLEAVSLEKEQIAGKLAVMENLVEHLKKDREDLELKLSNAETNSEKLSRDNQESDSTIKNLENEKKSLSQEKESIQKKFDTLLTEHNKLQSTIKTQESSNSKDAKKIAELQKEIETLKKEKESQEKLVQSEKDRISKLENEKIMLAQNIQGTPTKETVEKLQMENELLKKEQTKLMNELESLKNENNESFTSKLKEEVEILTKDYKIKTKNLAEQITRLKEREQELSLENERLREEIERLNARTKADLERKLSKEISDGDMSVSQDGSRIIINLYDTITFSSGSANLKKPGKKLIAKIVDALKNYPNRKIYIEGNTDDVPVIGGKYKDNWELSAARAISVLRYLEKHSSIGSENMVAVGNST